MEKLRSFVTDFSTYKRVVIPSKRLRIPELCCKGFLSFAVVAFFLCYQLHFYGEKSGLAFGVRPTYMHSESNWWICSMYKGSCRYDIPKKSELDYCQGNQTRPKWNIEKKVMEVKPTKIECNPFNFDKDIVEQPSQLWVTTSKLQVIEKAPTEGGDYQMASSDEDGVSYTMGPEQIVLFDAALPHELGFTSLMELQGFLNYDGGRDVRRIPFAKSGDWVGDGDGDDPGVKKWTHWVSQYPAKADGNGKKPGVGANDTGCFQVAEEGEGVFCHLSELLKAAGVDMDKNANSKPSRRLKGVTLNVEFKLTNWDVSDFWTWPFGTKPKYIVNVKASGRSHAALYRRYEQVNATTRRRVDHYGVNVNVTPTTSWAEIYLPNLCQTLVIVGAVLRYFDKFVIGILVQLYSWIGHDHISRLYEFNTLTRSAREEDIERAYKEATDDHIEFKNLHDKAEEEHLHQLHGKVPSSPKVSSNSKEATYAPLSPNALLSTSS